jgi:hypothetical protein
MQQLILSIPEPCHEDWQQMTPTQQGRYCNACAKQVVDFSAMSDAELLHYFSNLQNENVCGRTYPDQLERTIAMPVYPKKKLFWYWNYITMFFLFFAKSNTTKAQGGIKLVTEQKIKVDKLININEALQGRVGGMIVTKRIVVKGKITDENQNAIAGATIAVKGETNFTATDENGNYKLNVSTKKYTLQVSAIGYEKKEVVLDNNDRDNQGNIILNKAELTGDVVVLVGGISSSYYTPAENLKHIVQFEVTDNATMQPVSKAAIKIIKGNKEETVYTDKKGTYKLRKIMEDEIYIVTVEAGGYKAETLAIKGSDLAERKIVKQIFLEKEATLADYKKMDSVVINSYAVVGKLKRLTTACESVSMGALISSVTITRTITDTLNLLSTKITGAIKIYPNPVAKGNAFNLALKLKETGSYKIQITDALGRIVLIKQINTTAKSYTEQVQTNAAWSSGIYYLSISNPKNILISTGSFSLK